VLEFCRLSRVEKAATMEAQRMKTLKLGQRRDEEGAADSASAQPRPPPPTHTVLDLFPLAVRFCPRPHSTLQCLGKVSTRDFAGLPSRRNVWSKALDLAVSQAQAIVCVLTRPHFPPNHGNHLSSCLPAMGIQEAHGLDRIYIPAL
jgi:hypothetical protein